MYRKAAASDRYIHYTSAQAWKEKSSAIRTLKARAPEYCSDELLAEELAYLLEVFIQNGYPEKTVWRLLYQENKENKAQQAELNIEKASYVPYHPRTRRLYKINKKEFGYEQAQEILGLKYISQYYTNLQKMNLKKLSNHY